MILQENMNFLRQSLNALSASLAAAGMEDTQMADEMLCVLENQAAPIYDALSRRISHSNNNNDLPLMFGNHKDGFRVKWLQISLGNVSRPCSLMWPSPFILGPCRDPKTMTANEYLAAICGVAMFNVGLARHTQGLREARSTTSKALLEQAAEYYTQALKLLGEVKDISTDGTLVHVYLACLLNLTEICTCMNLVAEANDYAEEFEVCLWSVTPQAPISGIYRHFCNAAMSYHAFAQMAVFPTTTATTTAEHQP